MRIFKKAVICLVGAVPLMLPFAAVAHAAQESAPLQCNQPEAVNLEQVGNSCDLAIDKLVSVDGGNTFVEADTSAAAAQTTVGSTVIWKIIVSNNSSPNFTPTGIVTVDDVLPGGVSYVSSSATAGTYDNNAGTWVIPLTNNDQGTNLPATLTITSTSTATGLFENTASLSVLDYCSDDCIVPYSDANPSNNSNDAWIDPSAKPVVLAENTSLTNTGSGTAVQTIAAGSLIAATAATLLSGRKRSYKTGR